MGPTIKLPYWHFGRHHHHHYKHPIKQPPIESIYENKPQKIAWLCLICKKCCLPQEVHCRPSHQHQHSETIFTLLKTFSFIYYSNCLCFFFGMFISVCMCVHWQYIEFLPKLLSLQNHLAFFMAFIWIHKFWIMFCLRACYRITITTTLQTDMTYTELLCAHPVTLL